MHGNWVTHSSSSSNYPNSKVLLVSLKNSCNEITARFVIATTRTVRSEFITLLARI
jgi:hypothetical protein